eukprot:2915156-Alexandrium_andersonii.AAC.1
MHTQQRAAKAAARLQARAQRVYFSLVFCSLGDRCGVDLRPARPNAAPARGGGCPHSRPAPQK